MIAAAITSIACTPTQRHTLRWVAGLGAVTAEALAVHAGLSLGAANARLRALERRGLIVRERVLADAPALCALTRAGVRAAGARGLEPCRISVAGAPHAIACARAASLLERAYPDHRVAGERELRRDERDAGRALASAQLGQHADGAPMRHRPDLVLWPTAHAALPIAVEVELTVKAPRRLLAICRAWARSGCVAGTLYLAGEDVRRALERAIAEAGAGERIAFVAVDALEAADAFASSVPGAA